MLFSKVAKLTTFFSLAVGLSMAHANMSVDMMNYSTTATESNISFQARVGLRSKSTPTQSEAKQQVRKQIKWMQSHWRRTKVATLRSDWDISIAAIEKVGSSLYRIRYKFSGTAMVLNDLKGRSLEIVLPINPDTVEIAERVRNNACQDPDHGGGAFWYYWNPSLSTCNMTVDKDYLALEAIHTPLPATVQTFPEYNRLFVNGVMRGVILFGKVSESSSDDPYKGNPWSFPGLRKTLTNLGFTGRKWTPGEIREFVGANYRAEPYVEELTLQTRRGTISLILFYGNSGLKEDSAPFHRMYKYALENASFISYGGHAGTGKNLNLNMVRSQSGLKISPRTDLYQILHLSACFPYSYYVLEYFKFKTTAADPRGTKNLDILAEGVEGSFADMGPQSEKIIGAMVNYAQNTGATSYQEILASHPVFSRSLFSINGDEDNPTRADSVR